MILIFFAVLSLFTNLAMAASVSCVYDVEETKRPFPFFAKIPVRATIIQGKDVEWNESDPKASFEKAVANVRSACRMAKGMDCSHYSQSPSNIICSLQKDDGQVFTISEADFTKSGKLADQDCFATAEVWNEDKYFHHVDVFPLATYSYDYSKWAMSQENAISTAKRLALNACTDAGCEGKRARIRSYGCGTEFAHNQYIEALALASQPLSTSYAPEIVGSYQDGEGESRKSLPVVEIPGQNSAQNVTATHVSN